MIKSKTLRLIIAQGVTFSGAAIGSLYTSQGLSGWYQRLNKPAFNPPDWIFGQVWSLLFLLMGWSLYLVWNRAKKSKQREVWTIFLVQLFLNVTWSYLFFAAKKPPLALVEILVLWLAIGVMIVKFFKIKRLAGYLLLPYFLWVSFAAVLNYAYVALN